MVWGIKDEYFETVYGIKPRKAGDTNYGNKTNTKTEAETSSRPEAESRSKESGGAAAAFRGRPGNAEIHRSPRSPVLLKKMRVLIACERSGVVRDAFAMRGHDAWSCDIEPSERSGNHLIGDIREFLKEDWDLMIAHPPCTRLCVTGNKWYKSEYSHRFPNIHQEREEAIQFFMTLADAPIPHICIENPVGIMSTLYRKPDQIIQPFQFGHPEPKKTCLWLKGLPPLQPTKLVEPDYFVSKSGKKLARWYYMPSYTKERQIMRSRTFQGIADAMADQWSCLGGTPACQKDVVPVGFDSQPALPFHED